LKDFISLPAVLRWQFEVALAKRLTQLYKDDALELELMTAEKILEDIPKLGSQHRRERFERYIKQIGPDIYTEPEISEESKVELKEDIREVIFGKRRDGKSLKGIKKIPTEVK